MEQRQRIEKGNQYSVNSNQYLYPEDQSYFPEERVVSKEPWMVIHTKTKCEKFVRDRLIAMGLEAFVPLRKRTAKYNRKVKVYELPLITCYTFVRLDKTRRNEVLALPYVQGMLRTAGHDCLVSDREIQWLQKISGT
ncbi:MAG: UpxY family transcription antiterminator, partial [Saprospiraceae bacterium]